MSVQDLWAAVVQQAADDLSSEPYGTTDFTQAHAFFFGQSAAWTRARGETADFLALHADDLTRLGRKVLARRAIADGGMAGADPIARDERDIADKPPMPSLFVRPGRNRRARGVRSVRDRSYWIERFMARQAAGGD